MVQMSSRRVEHAADTRAALVRAARNRFTADGYAGAPIEGIVADARVTKGALYHHFPSKRDLFVAVLEDAQRDMVERIAGTMGTGEPWALLRAGCQAMLDACLQPDVQRLLMEAPAVLGADAWARNVEEHGLVLLMSALEEATRQEVLPDQPVEPLARLLLAMLTEAALYVARAKRRDAARRDVGATIDRILDGLRGP
jgi:AcrR family transcriptional regulator